MRQVSLVVKRAAGAGAAPRVSGSIAVLHKAFDVVELLQNSKEPKTLDEVVAATGIARSTAHRLLMNLMSRGYVEKDVFGGYQLGMKLLELGATVKQRQTLRQVARPIMEKLRDRLGETVNLGRLQDNTVLYLETIESQNPIRVTASLGIVDPVHATSIGKAMLAWIPPARRPAIRHWKRLTASTICDADEFTAELEKVRRQGYAVDDEESMEGGRCIGVPVLCGDHAVAGISVSGPMSRIPKDRIPEIARVLKEASAQISRQISLLPESYRR